MTLVAGKGWRSVTNGAAIDDANFLVISQQRVDSMKEVDAIRLSKFAAGFRL